MKKGILLLATAIVVLAAAANAADEFVADELLVAFQPGARGAQADGIRNGLRATKKKAWPEINAEHWRLPPGLGVAQAIQALSANPNVVYAEPNYIVHTSIIPNDPRLPELWGLHNIGQTGGTPDADADVLEACQLPPGTGSVVVGVIDTGVDYNHPDLAGKIWVNPGEIPGNGIDDDGNGFIDDIHGWDFVNNDNDPMDDYGHGTHVSGTIGAVGNNGIGIIGVAGLSANVMLMPLKFISSNGFGSTADAVSCINYAASFRDASGNRKVRITSNSWGGGGKSRTLENAIANAGALFVAAAGNNGTNTIFYPAAYPGANIIAVAATDNNDVLASFSNFSPDWVDLAAPGVGILSTTPNDNYASWNGTSMATPHVSGVAALLISQDPSLSLDAIKAQVLTTVDPLPSLSGKTLTGGRLNARKAMGAPELPSDTTPPGTITDLAAMATSPTSVTLTWTAPGDDGYTGTAYSYEVRYSINPILTDTDFAAAPRASGEPVPKVAGAAEIFTVTGLLDNRTWNFAIKTIDLFGNISGLSNPGSGTTPKADWRYLTMGWGQNIGNYTSLGVTAEGYWAVAFDDKGAGKLMCAVYPGGPGYYHETVGNGGVGPSLAYNASGQPAVSHVYGTKLLFATRIGTTNWTSIQIEGKDVSASDTSLCFDGSGRACISYSKTGRSTGLWVARLIGSVWSSQIIDGSKGTVFNQMAVDGSGNPAIAYSIDANGDGNVDSLKVARFNGTTWSSSVVGGGGWYATLAFDSSGNPAVAHWDATTGQLHFLRWNGISWSSAEVVESGPSITGCSLAIGPDGKAYLAYGSVEMRIALRDPASGLWTVLLVDSSTTGSLRNSLNGRPLMTPSVVAYRGPGFGSQSNVLLAFRQNPY
jgi:hypothetical protein